MNDGRCDRLAAEIAEAVSGADGPALDRYPCLTVAGTTIVVLSSSIPIGMAFVTRGSTTLVVSGLGIALAILAGYGTWIAPDAIETYRRRTAVGATPEIVAYAVLQARLTPSLERAAAFVGAQSDGLLARDIAAIGTGATTGRDGWEAVAAEWSAYDETFPRAVSLLAAGIESTQPARDELLDRALDTALAGTRDRVATFVSTIRAPASGIFAFGVMLPLALVGLLPVAASAGVGVTPALIAVLYDALIPLGLIVASAWLAGRRPAISRPPADARSLHSPRSTPLTVVVGFVAGAVAGGVAFLTMPPWTVGAVVPSIALGTGLVYWFEPLRARRKRVDEIESGMPDAVSLVGHRLATGEPLETALSAVGDRLTGETATVFREGTRIHRRLRVTVSEAFSGPAGSLASIRSPRAETAVALLVAAARNGATGGETLVSVASHLRDLDDLEREARRDLARTTDTLGQTAVVFAPAIAGVTVALATGMGSLGDTGQSVPIPALGLAIGGYVLALAVVLPALSVVLERGLDVPIVGHRVGIALLTSSAIYPVTFLAARSVVQV